MRRQTLPAAEAEECSNNFCEEEQVLFPLKALKKKRYIFKEKMYSLCDVLDSCFCQNYPGNEVLSALTQHPAMSDGLFQQLFDTQCKVGFQKLKQMK